MQVAFVALDSAPYRIGVAVSQWQKHDLFHLINPIGVVDTYDTPNASVSVFSAMSADALKMPFLTQSHRGLPGQARSNAAALRISVGFDCL